ncbi:hypothetical protein QLX08_010561 [Tetragonisca angustula]|uniref:Uncharacterized protein n=1 Tax=Tetragonisca angustula TaxID=166442 RepID=A0AAW0ZEH6_9HYME
MAHKKKDEETISTASTLIDPNIRAILDAMQEQNERYENGMAEMQRMLKIANEENFKRAKEIETLGKSLANLRAGSLATSDFNALITEDDSIQTAQTAKTTLRK